MYSVYTTPISSPSLVKASMWTKNLNTEQSFTKSSIIREPKTIVHSPNIEQNNSNNQKEMLSVIFFFETVEINLHLPYFPQFLGGIRETTIAITGMNYYLVVCMLNSPHEIKGKYREGSKVPTLQTTEEAKKKIGTNSSEKEQSKKSGTIVPSPQ